MKNQCDKCENPATIHLTEITGGQKIEKHLCEQCAIAEGITIKSNIPLSKLLEDFVLQSSGEEEPPPPDLNCEVCGMSFAEFREHGLLGCPNDYEAFGEPLIETLVSAQDGAGRHVGKVPSRAGPAQRKQTELLRLRGQLRSAVNGEQYEQAAQLRDRIQELSASGAPPEESP